MAVLTGARHAMAMELRIAPIAVMVNAGYVKAKKSARHAKEPHHAKSAVVTAIAPIVIIATVNALRVEAKVTQWRKKERLIHKMSM